MQKCLAVPINLPQLRDAVLADRVLCDKEAPRPLDAATVYGLLRAALASTHDPGPSQPC
jgi:hypothetical protein